MQHFAGASINTNHLIMRLAPPVEQLPPGTASCFYGPDSRHHPLHVAGVQEVLPDSMNVSRGQDWEFGLKIAVYKIEAQSSSIHGALATPGFSTVKQP